MRGVALVWCGLVLSMAGCSLDIDRLYGEAGLLDGGVDAPSMDVGLELDVGDTPVPVRDVPLDAPLDPLQLSLRDSFSMGAPTSIAALRGGGVDGVTRIGVTAVSTGELAILGVMGVGCGLRISVRQSVPSGFPGPVGVGALNADLIPDVVVGAPSMVTAFVGAEGMTEVRSPHPLTSLLAVDVGAFDAGAINDVLLVEDGAETLIGRGDGEGRFGSFLDPGAVDANLDGAFGDLDGDGSLDVLRLVTEAGNNRLLVTGGNGAGGFFGPLSAPMHTDALRVAVGYVDAPGDRPTAFVVGGTSIVVVRAEGGSLSALGPMTVASDANDVVLADLDGVPPREVVVSDGTSGLLHVLRWDGFGVEELRTFAIFGGMPSELAAVDADGDGDDEILVLVEDGVLLLSTGCL